MKKEQVFKEMTKLIKELISIPLSQTDVGDIKIRSDKIRKDIAGLNSCDADWFSSRYEKWYREELYPKNKDKIERIRDLTLSM